jgi:branched-chain amino acid transport system substrate-binding protein
VNGSVSVTYGKDPASPKYANDPAVKLYKQIIAKYAPGANVNDGLVYYGVEKAYDIVQLLYSSGKTPTRASLLAAAQKMNWTNPFTLAGVKVQTSGNDRFPISQVKLIRYNNGIWNEFGSLINGRGR